MFQYKAENGEVIIIFSDKKEKDYKLLPKKFVNMKKKFIDTDDSGNIFYNEEKENQLKKENIHNLLQNLCDTKSKEVKNYIAGKKVTDEQLRRWEEKYQMAKECLNGNSAYCQKLQLEADLQAITTAQLAQLIIQAGDGYKQALMGFNAMIEAFRVKVFTLIEAGEIDKAAQILEQVKNFGADTTPEDIKNIFNN